ncbi:TIM barrel protein [Haloarcula rubripromontorii]|uniref:TIM barrel protein n=2 Tax=Haloarcula rubripromontorii TaxID=1705562 RepID=A0A847TJC0_9EURY|nr:TIM barrel protein [Haloarcula rubripromontorii]
MICASTQCLPDTGMEETLKAYSRADIENVELGYCSEKDVDVSALVKEYSFNFVAHNYFLPVQDEFILNLASPDESLRRQSVDYVKDAINFCEKHDIPRYTFHGGFRVDPDLSLTFPKRSPPDYEACFERFLSSLQSVIDHATSTDVSISIENNVVTTENVVGGDPLLMFCRPDEFSRLFEEVNPSDCGVLLDTGHLNVSSHTFDYDKSKFVQEVADCLDCLHLHTNNGRADQHEAVNPADDIPVSSMSGLTRVVESHHGNARDLKQLLVRLGAKSER